MLGAESTNDASSRGGMEDGDEDDFEDQGQISMSQGSQSRS